MLSDELRKNLESAPAEARPAVLAALIRLAQEIEADHEEARVYHDEIERLHREADDAAMAARRAWESMLGQHGPDEHRLATETLASFRAEIFDVRQEMVRYRRLLVASLERVRENLRLIRALSIEHGLMTATKGAAIEIPEAIEAPAEADHEPPAIAGGADGRAGSDQSTALLLRRSPCVRLIFEGRRRCTRSRRRTRPVPVRRPQASDSR